MKTRIFKITIDGEINGEFKSVYWTPHELADYFQMMGTFEGMISEYRFQEEELEEELDG